jgi:hypothetical protein
MLAIHRADRLLQTIPVREELSAAPMIVVTRQDAPLAPAAGLLLDMMKRVSGSPSSRRHVAAITASAHDC